MAQCVVVLQKLWRSKRTRRAFQEMIEELARMPLVPSPRSARSVPVAGHRDSGPPAPP